MKYLCTLIFLAGIFSSSAQTSAKVQSVKNFQKEINKEFRDPQESPLTAEDRENFEGLNFFDIDTAYTVEAKFVRTPAESPFVMHTTTDRMPIYVKYGEVYFTLKGKKYKLNVYQSQQLKNDPQYLDYLFLPFTDKTNGRESYGGGRYIDLRIPATNTITIDFNKAYNPYCAYSKGYSCPIPPAENDLDIRIPVGVKKYHD
ncbi:MAG: DUF1684 domain-containing protein [Gillisia sp.]